MTSLRADLVVIGSGFGGSLAALLAHKRGQRVILIDRAKHPRFAIGESSTPIANLLLYRIATKYDLPWLRPFARYGEWKREHPTIPCGPKRGFAYIHHKAGQSFIPRVDHANELLVGSNPDEPRADCQWLRADVDAYIFEQTRRAGVTCFENAAIESLQRFAPNRNTASAAPWQIIASHDNQRFTINADFIIDATGSGILNRTLDIHHDLAAIQSSSRTLYSHFENVRHWRAIASPPQYCTADHPFPIDDATLHHVFDGGWMWIIRFDNGITSAGFCLEPDKFPLIETISPADEWSNILSRFPSIQWQFAEAIPILPFSRTGRIQRNTTRAAGDDWAMLPTTAGFIDAFFSTGNAHTLVGVMRLASILAETQPGRDRSERTARYDQRIRKEIQAIDRLVHGCYRSFHDMNQLATYSMLYFLAATYCEGQLRRGACAADASFLLAEDDSFQNMVRDLHARMTPCPALNSEPQRDVRSLLRGLHTRTADYNMAGLCDESKRNMYPYLVSEEVRS